jgi:hypothetical protein
VIDTGQFLAKAASGASPIEAVSTKQDLNPFLLSVALPSHGASFAARSELTPAFAAVNNPRGGVMNVLKSQQEPLATVSKKEAGDYRPILLIQASLVAPEMPTALTPQNSAAKLL